MQALVAQKPYDIGFQGVQQAVPALTGKKVHANIETTSLIVTKADMTPPSVRTYIYKRAVAVRTAGGGRWPERACAGDRARAERGAAARASRRRWPWRDRGAGKATARRPRAGAGPPP